MLDLYKIEGTVNLDQHSCFEDILWNEENYLRKEMGKEYGQPVDFVDWEVIKEEDNDR